jgi:hypothetical protein
MENELHPDLMAELSNLSMPAPETRFVLLENQRLNSLLEPEFSRFISRTSRLLDTALLEAPPAQVYENFEDGADRIESLFASDALLRKNVATDLAILVHFVESGSAPVSDLKSLMRATNRLRLAFKVSDNKELSRAGSSLCDVLLADFLEVSSFV